MNGIGIYNFSLSTSVSVGPEIMVWLVHLILVDSVGMVVQKETRYSICYSE